MTITKDHVVTMHYTLTNNQGETIDSSNGREPLAYIHGHNHIIPGLEEALEGKTKGDKLQVNIPAAQAYGEKREELVQELPIEQFDGTQASEIQKGMQFQANTPDGHQVILTVIDVQDDKITVDGNHQLAGEDLSFDVEITDVRAATHEELDHGHVHGPGGHQH